MILTRSVIGQELRTLLYFRWVEETLKRSAYAIQ